MIGSREIVVVSLLGLLTTSSSMVGAALGLYVPLSKRMLACVLAFAAGALISALTIELAFEGAQELHQQGFDANAAWGFIGSGFALGSIIYYFTSIFLDQKGAAIRYPTRFREYALGRKQKDAKDTIQLLSKCDVLRHLPPEEVERILPFVRTRHLDDGEVLFHAGDAGDALYVVTQGNVGVFVGCGRRSAQWTRHWRKARGTGRSAGIRRDGPPQRGTSYCHDSVSRSNGTVGNRQGRL